MLSCDTLFQRDGTLEAQFRPVVREDLGYQLGSELESG